jgi:plasmid stabilization system protein ParE
MRVEWSQDALADLDRFAEFLHERYPLLAKKIAGEIIKKAQILADRIRLRRAIAVRPNSGKRFFRSPTPPTSSNIVSMEIAW